MTEPASHNFRSVEEQLAYLRKGVAEIIPEADLKAKLENSLKTGSPLRVYLGVDPTAPDIHLGHTVVIRKLKQFQDLGHTAIFLIGDFSAMIGDPTGRSETRPPLTRKEVDANAKTYLDQVFKILDRQKTEVRYNSEWLEKLSSYEIVRLCGRYRLARMLEREDFRSRLENSLPISVHELLYPLLTAWDAVELNSDVEIGATEQKFNLLVHRDIQIAVYRERAVLHEMENPGVGHQAQRPQVCVTMPILVGLDGQRKMSKSLNNYIGITETPRDIFGKVMSISDELMWNYYDLITDRSPEEIAKLKSRVLSGDLNPKFAKVMLGEEVVSAFYGTAAASKAAEDFQDVYRDKRPPEQMESFMIALGPPTKVSTLLFISGLAPSRSEGERLIKQGAVEMDGTRVMDPAQVVDVREPTEFVLRAGKTRFKRIIVRKPNE